MFDEKMKKDLQRFALQIRIGTLESIGSRGFGHAGGSLSIADLLAVLYGAVMKVDPKNPKMEDRDKLVCSKGHAGPAVYATLGLKGFFPYDEIKTLNRPHTNFPSHCDKNKTPGIDATTGSLGQGSSVAVGIALGDKIKGFDSRTFAIIGDGEINEGQVWEALMFAAANKLTNFVPILDYNKKQLDGTCEEVLNPFDFTKKFESFGYEAISIDGHNVEEIYNALTKKATDKPIAIVLNTVKGKGLKEIEDMDYNHSIQPKPEKFVEWVDILKNELADFDK